MELDRKELKSRARERIGRSVPRFWVVALVYYLMTTGLSLLVSFAVSSALPRTAAFGSVRLFLMVLMLLYGLVLDFGYDLWSLWTYRQLDPGLGSLIQSFSVAGRVIWMEILIAVRIFAWALCLSLLITVPFLMLAQVSALLESAALALIGASGWAIALRYSLAPYLLADHPDDGAGAAVRRSVELMRGWKWDLFKLEFSFMGWILIGAALSVLVLLLSLWQAGFFQALAAMPALDLGELLSGYAAWSQGLELDFIPLIPLTEQQIQLYTIYSGVSDSLLVTLLSEAVTLPLFLWLTPYRSVSRAGFYDARLQLQQKSASPL